MTSRVLILLAIFAFVVCTANAQERPTERLLGHRPLNCPDVVRTSNLRQFEIVFGGITHHTITYPTWLDEYPITRSLFVIESRQSEQERVAFRDSLKLNLILRGKYGNSMKLVRNLAGRNPTPVVLNLAKMRLEENEDSFLEGLTDEQIAKIDGAFFWLLSRNDGILATVASNKFVYDRLKAVDMPLSDEQIVSIQTLADEFHKDLLQVEKRLLSEYETLLASHLPDPLVADLGPSKVDRRMLIPQFLDIVACDTRMFLEQKEFLSPTIQREYKCRTARGLRLTEHESSSLISADCDVELSFLTSLKDERSGLLPAASKKEIWQLVLVDLLADELSQIDREFAERGAGKQLRVLRCKNIERAVGQTVEKLKEQHPAIWDSLKRDLVLLKLLSIGPRFVADYMEVETAATFRAKLQQWLEKYDSTLLEIENSMLEQVTGKLDEKQSKLVRKLFKCRPDSKCNALSLSRLNSRFKFFGD